jgi:hypothetical protein
VPAWGESALSSTFLDGGGQWIVLGRTEIADEARKQDGTGGTIKFHGPGKISFILELAKIYFFYF